MRQTILKYISLLSAICVSFFAQGQTLSLQECVDLALERSISIKQSELDVESAELDAKDAFGNFLPTINGQTSHSWNVGLNQNITTGLLENQTTQFSSLGLNVGATIYNGLRNMKRVHRANLAIIARQYQLANMSENTSLLVVNAYLQIMFNREFLSVQQGQLDLSLKEIERTRALISSGVIASRDVFELEANIASLEQAVVLAENNLRLSKINLAQLLLITDYENFDISSENFDAPFPQILNEKPKDIFEKALTHRNDIKLSLSNMEVSKADIEIAKTSLQPTLSAFYGYSTRISYSDQLVGTGEFENREVGFVQGTNQVVNARVEKRAITGPISFANQFGMNDGHNFGVRLNIPILNGFFARNNIERSEVNLKRTENQYEQQKLDLEATINQAFNDAKGAYTLYEANKKTLNARTKAYEDATKRFEVGVINSFEYIQAKQRYESAVSDEIRAKFDYIFKLKILEFYFGLELDI